MYDVHVNADINHEPGGFVLQLQPTVCAAGACAHNWGGAGSGRTGGASTRLAEFQYSLGFVPPGLRSSAKAPDAPELDPAPQAAQRPEGRSDPAPPAAQRPEGTSYTVASAEGPDPPGPPGGKGLVHLTGPSAGFAGEASILAAAPGLRADAEDAGGGPRRAKLASGNAPFMGAVSISKSTVLRKPARTRGRRRRLCRRCEQPARRQWPLWSAFVRHGGPTIGRGWPEPLRRPGF